MKTTQIILLVFILAGINISCTSNAEKNKAESLNKSGEVTVYYFHNLRRCATCKAVEAVTEEAITEYYGDKVKFEVYNLEIEKGEKEARKLDVMGQTLLIVSGDKKINITNEAFMNARSNPDKLKQIIKEKIDPLIKA